MADTEATVLRLAAPDRLVVRLSKTGAVVELQLAEPVAPSALPLAHMVTPLRPAAAKVTPGAYRAGVFWGSAAVVTWPEPRPRPSRKRMIPAEI